MSHNQSIIYLSLLKIGTDSKASYISKLSGVARQDAYRVLQELHGLGLVQKIVSKPIRFRPVTPKEAIAILLEKKMSNLVTLNDEAELFAQRAASYARTHFSHEEDECLVISGRSSVIRTYQKEVENVRKTADLLVPSNEFVSWVIKAKDSFSFAIRSGVRIRWLINEPKQEEIEKICRVLSENPCFQLRCLKSPVPLKFGVYDSKRIILAMSGEGDFAQAPSLWSNSPAVVELARTYFESYWKNGVDIKPKNQRNARSYLLE